MKLAPHDVEGLDPDRIQRIRSAILSGDLSGLRSACDAATPCAGLNRGQSVDDGDRGLDRARDELRNKMRKQREGSDKPARDRGDHSR